MVKMDRKPKETPILINNLEYRKLGLYLPSAVSVLRLIIFPFLIFWVSNGQVFFGDLLFVFAICSDLADGYLARKMGVSSKFGASFDVAVDFIFISGMFLFFVVEGIYPVWVLLMIVFMFAQFKVTGLLTKVIYDPIGRYYGSLLYGAIGLTLLFTSNLAQSIIIISLVGVSITSLVSRLIYLVKKRGKH
jgi:phosphatidylglycerophosphate synthase